MAETKLDKNNNKRYNAIMNNHEEHTTRRRDDPTQYSNFANGLSRKLEEKTGKGLTPKGKRLATKVGHLTTASVVVVSGVAGAAVVVKANYDEMQEPVKPACGVIVNDFDNMWNISKDVNDGTSPVDETLANINSVPSPDLKDGLHGGDVVLMGSEECKEFARNPDRNHVMVPLSEVPASSLPEGYKPVVHVDSSGKVGALGHRPA